VTGFDPDFLPGASIPFPTASDEVAADYASTTGGEQIRHYTHYSLAMSTNRRFARWVAWNIDGSAIVKVPRKGMKFVLDHEYGKEHQVGDELYSDNRLDKGHIARRADLIWGPEAEARQANKDSFFFTNITPQLDTFNQESREGLWGELEDAIFADVDVDHLRVSLIGGPIFGDDDFAYRDVLVPRSFFKVIAYIEDGNLRAKAFVLTQDDLEANVRAFGLEPFKVFQTPVSDLETKTGLTFGELSARDTLPRTREAGATQVRRIRSADDYAAD
jgi:endonuclease G, mitochondrial